MGEESRFTLSVGPQSPPGLPSWQPHSGGRDAAAHPAPRSVLQSQLPASSLPWSRENLQHQEGQKLQVGAGLWWALGNLLQPPSRGLRGQGAPRGW